MSSSYALPIGVLTGVLLVLGRMSAEHEVTAIRAAGLSLPWVARPILLLAVLGVLAGVVVNFQFMPWARVVYHTELGNAVRMNPLSFIVPRTFIRDFPGKVLYVGEKNGQGDEGFLAVGARPPGAGEEFHPCRVGQLRFRRSHRVSSSSTSTTSRSKPGTRRIPRTSRSRGLRPASERYQRAPAARRLFGTNTFHRKLQWYTYPGADGGVAAAGAAGGGGGAAAAELDRMKLQMVVQDKFTTAFAVFSFALIGVPLGIKVSRRETSANLGLALALAMGYYFLTVMIGWLGPAPSCGPTCSCGCRT